MMSNLEKTRGLIFSQQLLLALTRQGVSREDAYRVVQARAMEVWAGKGDFKELVSSDPEITEWLSREEIDRIFDLRYHLKYVDRIFERVFEGS